MNILNLFKQSIIPIKEYTVEEIHQEFDSAEQKCIDECDSLLQSLNIPTETAIETKADDLLSLGFKNSSTVKQATEIKQRNNKLASVKQLTLSQVNTIKELKFKYPFEKFITVNELNRICKKYNLMYASVSHYIKDVPKKNIDDMKRTKKLQEEDACGEIEVLLELNELAQRMLNHMGRNNIFTLADKKQFMLDNYGRVVEYWLNTNTWFSVSGSNYCKKHGLKVNFKADDILSSLESLHTHVTYRKSKKINKSGLFIAAPKSHFDLKGLSKESEFGFFEVKEVEIKDPVVFEFCKNDIVRILTKWGDENESNYSEVNNEILN